MKANTALAFVICSLLLLVATLRPSPFKSFFRWGLAAFVSLISLLTLFQYVTQIDLGIDQLLAASRGDTIMTSSPGRMAPTSALGFLAFAVAVMIDHWEGMNSRIIRRSILALLILLAIGAILGYAYGAPTMYLGIDSVTAMALSTAILFLTLGIGGVWLRPEYGLPAILMERTLLGSNVRALLPIVVGAPLLVGAAVAAGYGRYYEGEFAIAITSLGSVIAASLITAVSVMILRKSEAAILIKDRALAASPSGIIVTDHLTVNEPIVYINPAFAEISGFNDDDIIGRNCRILNRDVEGCEVARQTLRQCIEDGGSTIVELQNRRKDGTLFWNQLSISPIHGRDNVITHYVGVVDDISAKRQQHEQLQSALRDTRKANAIRNNFVRQVSHELRTPLNAALTWVRLMEVDDKDSTRNKGIQVIADSIETQSRLIDDLVDATRYGNVGIRIDKAEHNIRDLTDTAVQELRPTIEQEHSLTFEVADGDYLLHVDGVRFRQIVRNLLSNAHKYTPSSGRIAVRLSADVRTIELQVSDTGKGLDQEEIANVFEPFWRAESNQPGLGVGLSIVHSLVMAHSGTIDVLSKGAGSGCTFTVRLPRTLLDKTESSGTSGATASTPPSN